MIETSSPVLSPEPSNTARGSAAGVDLFLVSLLVLFLEMACIRWFPAHVLFLTFFTNTVLLASFLGMSLGCLAASRPRHLLALSPLILVAALGAGMAMSTGRNVLQPLLHVGDAQAPQVVYFGTELATTDPTRVTIPIEAIEGLFFLVTALIMIGPGQELGRAFTRVPNRIAAYSWNILGSLTGVAAFAALSWLEVTPPIWFAIVAALVGYALFVARAGRPALLPRRALAWVAPALGLAVAITTWTSGETSTDGRTTGERLWSPYYRIDYYADGLMVRTNLIGHQQMVSRADDRNPSYAYAVPYLLRRDAGGAPFRRVLIIGAGSGNDVSRALGMGAEHVDAVEIDPVIQRLGARDHPDHPYQDPRVTVHITDGRNFLKESQDHYDLIIFALVDSLVLHSGYSNLRLESFMFTREALADVKRRLAPGGVFAMYNFLREGWIAGRLDQTLGRVFGADPIVLTLPYRAVIGDDAERGFTILLSGETASIAQAFGRSGGFWMPAGQAPSSQSPNGFLAQPAAGEEARWIKLGPARVEVPAGLREATDDWPFLYMRAPMIPDLSWRGIAVMGGLSLVLFAFAWRTMPASARRWRLDGRMLFLGAGFMLVETKAVVHMALLFGSTWMVNSVVFAGVLVMILAANLYVARVRPVSLVPYYAGLFVALALNLGIPLDALLGLGRGAQIAAACVLAFSPILFAGVIFAVSFSRSDRPDVDFGTNVAGAILGGLAENASLALGFQYLTVVILGLYVLSAVSFSRSARQRSG
jgi:SAM-dependent methyltransferase